MTVAELFNEKYRAWLKEMPYPTWRILEREAKDHNRTLPEEMYFRLEITQFDIKRQGGYKSELYANIEQLHKEKILAANIHRQEHGHVDRYWLTKKGMKKLAKELGLK